jgi:hypothetical protein
MTAFLYTPWIRVMSVDRSFSSISKGLPSSLVIALLVLVLVTRRHSCGHWAVAGGNVARQVLRVVGCRDCQVVVVNLYYI